MIKKDGLIEAIYEGLIHTDFKYLQEHIVKAVTRYIPSGCRTIYIGEYYKNKRFEQCWRNTVEKLIEEYDGKELDTGRDGVCLFRFAVDNLSGKAAVWVIGVNVYAG